MTIFPMVLLLIVFILGASIGSFLNVVIYRLPAGLSLLNPPSHCPHCGHRLKAYDNVPVLGWLWLRGRCRYCQAAIAPRYPIVEALTGFLFVFTMWRVGDLQWLTANPISLVGHWVLLSWLLALSLIDLDTLTLPNPLTQSGLVLGLVYQAVLGWTHAGLAGAASYLMGGIVGAVVGIWLLDTIVQVGSRLLKQQAMGAGDSKLAALMGAWLGWKYFLLAGFLACLFGSVVGTSAIALGLLKRRQPMPFGPFLALGTVIALFFGEQLINLYIGLVLR